MPTDVYDGEYKAGKREGRGTSRRPNEESSRRVSMRGAARIVGPTATWMWASTRRAKTWARAWGGGRRPDGVRLRDGQPVEKISLEEARRIAAKHGLPRGK